MGMGKDYFSHLKKWGNPYLASLKQSWVNPMVQADRPFFLGGKIIYSLFKFIF